MTHASSGASTNVTDEVALLRRQLERERARRLAAEDIGERATAELFETVQQLRAAQEELVGRAGRLEELDRVKDAFVSNVSHELRTPLTSISGYLELMADGTFGEVPDTMLRGIDIIARNADRLRRLVEDLLTMSTYDAGEVTLRYADVDLAHVVADCHRSLLPSIEGRDLDLRLLAEHGLPALRADAEQVERMVLNLMTNAVKFTPDGGRVTVAVKAHGPGSVALRVADTGMGIPAAEQDQVFSRFFRSSLSVAAEIQGTGLGLALTKTIVDLHHGSVALDSTEGEGTTVTVVLPVRPPH